MNLQDEEDFKNEIIQLKRQLQFIQDENKLLKVKNRKLQTRLEKKDKQIDALLEPVKVLTTSNSFLTIFLLK